MFPSRYMGLPHAPVSSSLQGYCIRSLTENRGIAPPKSSISISTTISLSLKAWLRPTSTGTSYHGTRLAFHPYSQVRRTHVRRTSSGLHEGRTSTSPCPGIDRPASGRTLVTMALSYHAPRKLRAFGFPASTLKKITLATKIHSLARYSKRTLELRRALAHYNY